MKLWPPLKGTYRVINPEGDVAVITRASLNLSNHKAFDECNRIAIMGSCVTENVGLDKVITNIITNGRIRNLLICGKESKGHNVGDALLKLVIEGVDENKRIINAVSADPRLKTKRKMIERFREQIINVKTINTADPVEIINTVNELSVEDMLNDYPYEVDKEAKELINSAINTKGAKAKFKEDSKGYFIIEVLFNHIVVRHKNKAGEDRIIIGNNAEEICHKIIELKLTKKIDHAMYLGRELRKAETALKQSKEYIQDSESVEDMKLPETPYLKTAFIEADNLSEAWLKAINHVYLHGEDYNVGKYDDAQTKDLPLIIHIKEVSKEPLFHKAAPRAESKEEYAQEFLEGSGFEKENEPAYTHHSRLKHRYDCEIISSLPNITTPEELEQVKNKCKDCKLVVINQVDEAIKLLKKDPTLRRVNLVTWMPYKDLDLRRSSHAPCLVLIQPRINRGRLDFFVVFRSQDLYKEFPSNAYAIIKLQKYMAEQLGVKAGAYTHFTISMHIYEKAIDNVEELLRQERLI